MRKSSKILFTILVLCWAVMPATAQLVDRGDDAPFKESFKRWGDNRDPGTGRYLRNLDSHPFIFRFALDGLYYYGDAEPIQKMPLGEYLNIGNLGGAFTVSFLQPVHQQVAMRYSIGAGLLRGDDMHMFQLDKYKHVVPSKVTGKDSVYYERNAHGEFNNIFVKAAVGAQYYPILGSGFYIYGGVQLNASFIQYNYGPYIDKKTTKQAFQYSNEGDKRYMTLNPQLSLELGYEFQVTEKCQVGVHLGADIGFIDTYIEKGDGTSIGMSLDARPSLEAGKFGADMADGYGFIGVSITYDWQPRNKGRRIDTDSSSAFYSTASRKKGKHVEDN